MGAAILLARSKREQISDWIACTVGSGRVLVRRGSQTWVLGLCLGRSPSDGSHESAPPRGSAVRSAKRALLCVCQIEQKLHLWTC